MVGLRRYLIKIHFHVHVKVERNESRSQPYAWMGNGLNPLYEAARNGNITMVKLLLEYGAVPQTRTYNALTGAVQFNHSEIVKLLLDYGADSCVQDELGRTPLDWAQIRSQLKVANVLQEYIRSEHEQVKLRGVKSQ